MPVDDATLLRRYAREHREDAFAELVQRHVDGVYSAALRRVGGDVHLAEDVTQQVFVALAQKAASLSRHPVLTGWLYLTTRNEAANVVRTEQRRKAREQEAHAMHELLTESSPPAEWSRVAPLLDSAVDELSAQDRTAVLLRFVDRRGFSEIGSLLRLTEDAARMRVDRALDKLRAVLARQGVTSTAAALNTLLGTNAVSAAPPGFAATVASGTAAALSLAAPTLGFVKFMSTTKVTLSLAGLAIVAAAVVVTRRTPPATSETAVASSATVSAPLRRTTKATGNETPPAEISQSTSASKAPPSLTEAELKIAALKDILAESPERSIPQIALATDGDWHSAVDGELASPDDYRRALGKLRASAEGRFAKLAQPALAEYLKANSGQFPKDTSQLQAFLPNLDPAMLAHYRVAPKTDVPNVSMGGEWILTQHALVDPEYDSTFVIGPYGFGSTNVSPEALRDRVALKPVIQAYKAAHHDQLWQDAGELLPYASTPEQQSAVQREIQRAARKR